ncbi:E3 ubiquitin-protein ligase MARCH7-like [Morone saxatilis]|uniref:E3 ubiquitin-protein ligase MARCH7-like n=1 Tax=Morone saxatilis TaxID=34816 RepID=UPI0015E1FCF6|nr:E3 ubiquitin-protein ligase MARCH7-like [Morone saxatilis]
MFGVRRKQQDLDHQNQDQRWDRETADTEMKRETPGMQTFSTQYMSAARKASKLSPCSSGKSVSSERGGPWNKGSVSRLQAISSETQSMTAELAATSKIPHSAKAPLASRSFLRRLFQGNKDKVHPAQYHNKHRPEHVKDRVLNGSTHGEASKQTQIQDILRSKNEMKHLFSKTNTEEIIDPERPTSSETLDFLGGVPTVPRLSSFDMLSRESEEGEADDGLFSRDAYKQSSSASATLSHSTHCLQSFSSQLSTFSGGASVCNSDGYSLIPLLEQARQPHVAPLPPITNRVRRSFVACTHQHLPELQSRWRTSQTSLASSLRPSCCQRQSTLVNREEDAVQKGTITTDRPQPSSEAWSPSTSGQLDNLNTDDMMALSDIGVHDQECQATQGEATAVQNAQSLQDGNKEIVCRLTQRSLVELSNEEDEDQCRICHGDDSSPTNPLISPCLCSGSLQFIHLHCLKRWIQTKLESGSELYIVKRCELCLGGLTLAPDTFDLDDYCRSHNEEVDITLQLHVREVAEMVNLSSSLSRAFLHSTVPSAVPRTRMWTMLNYIMRMRRIRDGRNLSPEPSDT